MERRKRKRRGGDKFGMVLVNECMVSYRRLAWVRDGCVECRCIVWSMGREVVDACVWVHGRKRAMENAAYSKVGSFPRHAINSRNVKNTSEYEAVSTCVILLTLFCFVVVLIGASVVI